MIKNQKCGSIIAKKRKPNAVGKEPCNWCGKEEKIVKVVLDIETDELNASVVNCIVAKNIDTNITIFTQVICMYLKIGQRY